MPNQQNIAFNWSIIGHKNVISFLQRSLLNSHLHQAYIFAGPKHLGKTAVAKNFIQSLLCENLATGGVVPCYHCYACQQINSKIHPDVFQVDLEHNEKNGHLNKNIGLEQIKELQSKLSRCSFLNSYKVALIHNADALSEKGFNALLKTLEEPTPKTILILLVNQLDLLPLTILSRCQVIKFLTVPITEIAEHLLKLGASKILAEQLSALAGGCPGLAINFYEDENLFLGYQKQADDFIQLVHQRIDEKFKFVNDLTSSSPDFSETVNYLGEILNIWRGLLRDTLLISNSCSHLLKNQFLRLKLEKLANRYSGAQLNAVLKSIDQTSQYLQQNVNPKLAMENLVLSL